MTPLYDGCNNPEVTRLSFTLELLKMKAKNNWTDTSLDELLEYLKKVLPTEACVLLVSRRQRKSCALLICHTLDITHASMIAPYSGTSTQKKPSVQSAMLHDIKRP